MAAWRGLGWRVGRRLGWRMAGWRRGLGRRMGLASIAAASTWGNQCWAWNGFQWVNTCNQWSSNWGW